MDGHVGTVRRSRAQVQTCHSARSSLSWVMELTGRRERGRPTSPLSPMWSCQALEYSLQTWSEPISLGHGGNR